MLEKLSISLILYKSIILYLPCFFCFFNCEKHSRSSSFCVFRTILDQNFANQHFRKGQVTSLDVNFSDQSLLWEKSRCIEIFWLLLHKRLCTILPLENLYVVCNKVYLKIKINTYHFQGSLKSTISNDLHQFCSLGYEG